MGISDLISIIKIIFGHKKNYRKKDIKLIDFSSYRPLIYFSENSILYISKFNKDEYENLKKYYIINFDYFSKNFKEYIDYKNISFDKIISFYEDKGNSILVIPLSKNEKVFGLGSKFAPFERNNFVFDNFNTDNPYHATFVDNLYTTLNIFYIFDENTSKTKAFIIDYPGFIRYDFGKTKKDEIRIKISSNSFNILQINADNLYDAVSQVYCICSTFYKPPFHAFGYTYSHWGIKSIEEVERITKEHEKEDIPLSNICLDIDYMESYKNFTINERFEGFKNICLKLKEKNIFLIPIIDAAIKVEKNYFAYEKFKNFGILVKNDKNDIYTGIVWPGSCIFPDFFTEEDQSIFKELMKDWIEKTETNGCWLDMNEPSIFNEKNRTFPDNAKFLNGKVPNIKLHNMYPYFEAKAALESFVEKGIRPMLFSRSFYTFQGRFCGNWTGDNQPRLSHLLMGFSQIINLSLAATMYCGNDIGGFWYNPSNKLLIDWFKASLFHPLFRNHSSIFAKPREIPKLKQKVKIKIKKIIEARHKLLASIYSLFMYSIYLKKPYIMPYIYEEENKYKITDKVIVISETIGYDPFDTKLLENDKNYKCYNLSDEINIYIKKGAGIFLTDNTKPAKNIYELTPLTLIGFFNDEGKFSSIIYLDDGITSSSLEKFAIYKIIVEKSDKKNVNINNNKIKDEMENNTENKIENREFEINIEKLFDNLDDDFKIKWDKILKEIKIKTI